jgi:hypothetical protein
MPLPHIPGRSHPPMIIDAHAHLVAPASLYAHRPTDEQVRESISNRAVTEIPVSQI